VASTAAGALIGALLGGGAGAIPGAEAGFEIGLLILEYYGLYQLVKAVLEVAGNLVAKLGEFIKLVWTANGDRKQIDQAGRTLADALGILVAAALVAVVAYLLKKGGKALSESKFAKTVGETRLAQWFNERQKLTTSKELLEKGKEPAPGAAKFVPKVGDNLETLMACGDPDPRVRHLQIIDVADPREGPHVVRRDLRVGQARRVPSGAANDHGPASSSDAANYPTTIAAGYERADRSDAAPWCGRGFGMGWIAGRDTNDVGEGCLQPDVGSRTKP
jgi:hypothetical protein